MSVTLVSSKLRPEDHARAGSIAAAFDTNRLDVLTAAVDALASLPPPEQRSRIRRAERRYPTTRPRRVGRGNRRSVPAA